jgi:CHAD domain-containing protein
MAYRFEVGEAVGDALRRVVAEEVVAAENSLALVLASQSPEAVHDVRKRTKKLRAAIALVSTSVPRRRSRSAHRATREAARVLAGARDAHVAHQTLIELIADDSGEFGVAMGIAAEASGRRCAIPDDEAIQHASWLLTGVVAEVSTWKIPDRFESVADGLASTYRDGRRRWRQLATAAAIAQESNVSAVHRWRQAVKTRWYHTRLLVELAPDVLGAEARLLNELGEVLGTHHDLSQFIVALAGDPERWGGAQAASSLARIADQRRLQHGERAATLANQLFVDTTANHVGRLAAWWRTQHAG